MKLLGCLLCLAIVGCTTHTEYGECIGVLDDPSPHLLYRVAMGNVILGAVFGETLVVPAVVLFAELKCPVGRKE